MNSITGIGIEEGGAGYRDCVTWLHKYQYTYIQAYGT